VYIIHNLRSILARHGIPEELVTVLNIAVMNLRHFCSELGIKHTTSSPLYPQRNGLSELLVQTVKDLLKKAEEAGKDL